MVSLTAAALLSLAAIGALAAPHSKRQDSGFCMTYDDARQVAVNYGDLIASYSKSLADQTLTSNFMDYSESVNTLIDSCPQGSAAQAMSLPLLAATFGSLAQFEGGQSQQPPINFNLLQTWNTCNTVIMRWETTNTANITSPRPVVGVIIAEVLPGPGGQFAYQIDTVWSEFDSGAWLQNLEQQGNVCKSGGADPTVTIASAPIGSLPAATPSTSATSIPAGSVPVVTSAVVSTSVTTTWTSTSTTVWETASTSTWVATSSAAGGVSGRAPGSSSCTESSSWVASTMTPTPTPYSSSA